MKVRCINIYNDITKQYEDQSYWLTIGKEYIVLEVKIYPGKEVFYRLVGDNSDKSPGLYDSRQFEITSNKLPSNWIVYQFKDGIYFSPQAWQTLGFWEDCYNLEPAALEIYRREATQIHEEGAL